MFLWVDAAQDTPPRIRQRTRTMMHPGTPCRPAKDETIAALWEQLAQGSCPPRGPLRRLRNGPRLTRPRGKRLA